MYVLTFTDKTPSGPLGPFMTELESRAYASMNGLDPDSFTIQPLVAPKGGVHDDRYLLVVRPAEAPGPCKHLAEQRVWRRGQDVTDRCDELTILGNKMAIYFEPAQDVLDAEFQPV